MKKKNSLSLILFSIIRPKILYLVSFLVLNERAGIHYNVEGIPAVLL